MSNRLSDEFKKLFVEYISSPKCNAAQITSQFVKGKIDRHKKEQVSGYDDEMDSRIAHFWDSNHDFWKRDENVKYGITSESKLPITYANVASFKRQVAKLCKEDIQLAEPPKYKEVKPIIIKNESIADRKLRLNRELLFLQYQEAVQQAQEALRTVTNILENNPKIATQEELDALLNPQEGEELIEN